MKRAAIVVVMASLLAATGRPAFAHQLDEYLQATTLDVQPDHVRVKLRLTPGVAVVETVLAQIDRDHDGVLSEDEKRAYVEHVRSDLELSIDDRKSPLNYVSATYPSVDAMREGNGEIVMMFDANVSSPPGLERQLTFANRHRRDVSSYLVNAILAGNPPVRVLDQTRSEDQSTYHSTYARPDWLVLPIGMSSAVEWLIAIALVVGGILTMSKRRHPKENARACVVVPR